MGAVGGALPTRTLAARLGLSASALVLRLLPLEKTGLITRAVTPAGMREVALRAPGRRLLGEARETALEVCAARATAGPGKAGVA